MKRKCLFPIYISIILYFKCWLTAAASLGGYCSSSLTLSNAATEISISSLVQIHTGPDCTLLHPGGLQTLEATRWAVERLNHVKFIPGVNIGVNVWDTCGDKNSSLTAVVEAVVTGEFLVPSGCQTQPHVGVILAQEDVSAESEFLTDVKVPFLTVDTPDLTPQLEATAEVLKLLNWTHVTVISSSQDFLTAFSDVTAEYSICVSRELLITSDYSMSSNYTNTMKELATFDVTAGVIIGSLQEILGVLSATKEYHPDMDWLLVPTGPVSDDVFQDLEEVISGAVMIKRLSETVPEFGRYFRNLKDSSNDITSLSLKMYNNKDYVEEPSVIPTIESLYKLAAAARLTVTNDCSSKGWCGKVNVSRSLTGLSEEKTEKILQRLEIKAQNPKYQILRIIPNDEGVLYLKEVGKYYGNILSVDKEALTEGGFPRPRQHRCSLCPCMNIRFSLFVSLKWRQETWIISSTTVALIGILVSLAICIFLIIQACSGSAHEGSQFFTIMLVLASMFLYLALLPFCFQASEITCFLRPFVTGIAYALVFSILVARSLMLATADSEGLIGHVSGVVQCALLFFMMIVQIGLGLQKFLLEKSPLYSLQTEGQFSKERSTCSEDHTAFLLSLSYVIFLLGLQLLLAPFIVKSRRNYHEGLLFFVATVLVTGTWVGWTTLYAVLSPKWGDASICLGLVMTPTSLIISIFIPKTYLMVKAEAIESMPPSILSISRPQSVHDLTASRASSLALYDSIGNIPDMAYTNAPHVMFGSREPSMIYKQSGYCEAYNPYTPSPKKVTVF